jgi:hypothetical protein
VLLVENVLIKLMGLNSWLILSIRRLDVFSKKSCGPKNAPVRNSKGFKMSDKEIHDLVWKHVTLGIGVYCFTQKRVEQIVKEALKIQQDRER